MAHIERSSGNRAAGLLPISDAEVIEDLRAEVERLRQRETDLTSEVRGLHEALRKETAEVERLGVEITRIVGRGHYG